MKERDRMYKSIDLFAGIGGIRLGFDQAFKDDIETVFISEWDEKAQETYYANFGHNLEIAGDITKIDEKDIPAHDILLAGFPCQAFSLAGQRKGFDDARGTLFFDVARIAKHHQPKVIFAENVKNLVNHDRGRTFKVIKAILTDLGYTIFNKVLNSKDFGVPQNRKRVIIMGFKKGLNVDDFKYPENKGNIYMVEDFLNDLPSIKSGEVYKDFKYRNKPTEALLYTKIRDKEDLLTHHISRPNNDRELNIYRIAVELWNKKDERLKYSDLPDELITHKNTKSFLDRFKVVAGDLNYSQTIVAHIAKDGHYYIHPNMEENRSLSIREAARLQSFPDNYFFEGSRTSNFTQIGNAVPPLMAEYIAEWIKENVLII